MQNKEYLKHATIYQVYPRNHTPEGTFQALIKDLERIKALDVDILYLLPIHPLGEKSRKGTLGSPYAIKDYYAINPEHGSLADFKALIRAAHELELKVMIDIVLHHTSPDAVLLKEHPEFYFLINDELGNKVGDWSDIIDLDYRNRALWDYMLKMLTYWAELGVDGFRADVAPMIPLEFWRYVRMNLDQKFPHLIWLSESVEPGFISFLKEHGHIGHTDLEMYEAFDVLYDYDIYPDLKAYLEGKKPLSVYVKGAKRQEKIYPEGYLKIRTIENHDTARIAALCENDTQLRNVTAWSFFQNGVGFLYAGQEVKATHRPTLFDQDTINLKVDDPQFYKFIEKLVNLKRDELFSEYDIYRILNDGTDNTIMAVRVAETAAMYGFFNFAKEKAIFNVPLDDGLYRNLLGGEVVVYNGKLKRSEPTIILIELIS
ncbi:MAG TPA: alpha-amylase family glycosyl hydrolase [Bacilli bacterium]|nr:alpha-amylase family glycosyl hydrolase [Bacilli bacterium]